MTYMLYQNFKLASGVFRIEQRLTHSFTTLTNLKDQFNYLFLKIAERIIFYEYRAIASRQKTAS